MKTTLLSNMILIGILITAPVAFAQAPVVDITQVQDKMADSDSLNADQQASAPTVAMPVQPNLSADQRLDRIEQQLNNLTAMNLPQQIDSLQQSLAQLRGQLQVQEHDLKLLNTQQRSFYQDLDQRIDQLKNLSSGDSASNTSPVKAKKANSSNNSNIHLKDANAYQRAFKLLEKKQYDQAQQSFQEYLEDYPNGQYVSNAHYWQGEIYSLKKQYKKAQSQFEIVIKQFPKSSKVLDARLKLAIIHAQIGKVALARSEFKKIKTQHPDSTAAQLATIHLQQLDAAKTR